MEQIVRDFTTDTRTRALFAFIIADIVTGVIASLRTNTFDMRRLAGFYRSSVLPYILGYFLIYLLTLFGMGELLGPVMSEIAATVGVGPAVLTLVASIAINLAVIRTTVPKDGGKQVGE